MQTMYPAQANSPSTELVTAIDATQDTITLADASIVLAAPNLLTIGTDEYTETILYTGKSGNDLTGVTRGFQGIAQSWVTGTKVARFLTAYDIDSMRENIIEVESIANSAETPLGAQAKVDTLAGIGNTKTVREVDDAVVQITAQLADTVLKPSQTTAEIQSALDTAVNVVFTAGTYKLNPLTIPSNVKSIKAYGNVKFIPGDLVPSVVATSWVTALNLSDAEINGIKFEADSDVYFQLKCLDLTLCTDTIVERVHAIKGGAFPIYGANCTDVTIRNCNVRNFLQRGIHFEGALQSDITIENNTVNGDGAVHCISAQLGTTIDVSNNKVRNSSVFGIGLYQVTNSVIRDNKTHNTGCEGVNTEDCNTNLIINNSCRWEIGSGTDFGISVYGNVSDEQFNIVANNIVVNSYKSGICLAGRVNFTHVTNNQVLNCNRGKVVDHCGILLYGTNCVKNKVTDNTITDTSGTLHEYGIGELDLGTGVPTLNEISGNRIEGFIKGDIKTTNTTTLVAMNSGDLGGFRTYNPSIVSTVGTITTASANGFYFQMGKIVFFYTTATITANGSGAGALTISLPFTPVVGGSGSGKELVTSGKALTVEIGTTIYAQVRTYDNEYPASNGSVIQISGMYQVA